MCKVLLEVCRRERVSSSKSISTVFLTDGGVAAVGCTFRRKVTKPTLPYPWYVQAFD